MDRQEALAIAFANLKGSRRKDLIRTAEALRYLKSLADLGSNRAVGKAVGVSGEIVREFVSLLDLPKEVQTLLAKRTLSLEKGRRLWQLGRSRPGVVQDAAAAMVGMSVLDARHLVEFLISHPDSGTSDAKNLLLASKTVKRREFHVVATLPEDDFSKLSLVAAKRGLPVSELVTDLIRSALEDEADGC